MYSLGFSRYKIILVAGIFYFSGFGKDCESHIITEFWPLVFSNKTYEWSYSCIHFSISYDVTLICGQNQPLKENSESDIIRILWVYKHTSVHTHMLNLFCLFLFFFEKEVYVQGWIYSKVASNTSPIVFRSWDNKSLNLANTLPSWMQFVPTIAFAFTIILQLCVGRGCPVLISQKTGTEASQPAERAGIRTQVFSVLMSVLSNTLKYLLTFLLLLKPTSSLSSEESGTAAQHPLL